MGSGVRRQAAKLHPLAAQQGLAKEQEPKSCTCYEKPFRGVYKKSDVTLQASFLLTHDCNV
jgi:hypothetical protein